MLNHTPLAKAGVTSVNTIRKDKMVTFAPAHISPAEGIIVAGNAIYNSKKLLPYRRKFWAHHSKMVGILDRGGTHRAYAEVAVKASISPYL